MRLWQKIPYTLQIQHPAVATFGPGFSLKQHSYYIREKAANQKQVTKGHQHGHEPDGQAAWPHHSQMTC